MLKKINVVSDRKISHWSKVGNLGPYLVMLHGHGGDHRGLIKFAEQLERNVIIVDLPGFGTSSELPEHSMNSYVESLMDFITSQNIKAYNLLGHSLGSAIALALAAEDVRVKKLVLVNPVPEFSKVVQRLIKLMGATAARLPEKTSEALIHAGMYNLATFLLHSTKRRDLTHIKHYLGTQKTAQYSLKAWREAGEAIYEMDQPAFAKKVKAETLLIHGDKDKMTTLKSVKSFTDLFEDAKLVRITKAGHFIPLENVDESAQEISKFLTD